MHWLCRFIWVRNQSLIGHNANAIGMPSILDGWASCPPQPPHLRSKKFDCEMSIKTAITFICSSCQEEALYAAVVGPAVSARMAGRNHWRVKDGDEPVTCACPECGEDALLVDEGECAACFSELEYSSCEDCEEPLSLEERLYSEGKCSYCQHRWDKIMAE